LDREGKRPFELLDEIEEKLRIKVRPLSWPISMGSSFKGVYNIYNKSLNLFRPGGASIVGDVLAVDTISDSLLDERIGEYAFQLREDIALIEGVYEPFERQRYLDADLAPVFFGSAVNNFGVKELLATFTSIAPAPRSRLADTRAVHPDEKSFSGFVFKIHANLDPKHRDRIAFLRICSGKFERNKFFHHVRMGKDLKFRSPASFMAQEKSIIEEAYPGDVIGLYDTGNFKIGDTLTEGEKIMFQGIPSFSPEVFKEVINTDPMRSKQLEKGLKQLTDEGVAQLFIQQQGKKRIVGTVGELQFDVIQYRLLHEYGASCRFSPLNFNKACWITSHDAKKLDKFCEYRSAKLGTDKYGNTVFFAESDWELQRIRTDYPDIEFHFSSEINTGAVGLK
jgi:peptide chain release factor 3